MLLFSYAAEALLLSLSWFCYAADALLLSLSLLFLVRLDRESHWTTSITKEYENAFVEYSLEK